MDLTNYLRKDFATPSIYYGYSSDSNAASTDFNWSIRKVTTATNVETVTWSNGNSYKGKFIDDIIDLYYDEGVFTFADGSKYIGKLKKIWDVLIKSDEHKV